MRLLVLHQNFPGQFGHLVRAWSRRPGWAVRALGRDTTPGLPGFNGLVRYKLARAARAPAPVPSHHAVGRAARAAGGAGAVRPP